MEHHNGTSALTMKPRNRNAVCLGTGHGTAPRYGVRGTGGAVWGTGHGCGERGTGYVRGTGRGTGYGERGTGYVQGTGYGVRGTGYGAHTVYRAQGMRYSKMSSQLDPSLNGKIWRAGMRFLKLSELESDTKHMYFIGFLQSPKAVKS